MYSTTMQVIGDGQSRNIGCGIMVAVSKNKDGSYQVTVSGGKIVEFQRLVCASSMAQTTEYDTSCVWDPNKPFTPDNSSDVRRR